MNTKHLLFILTVIATPAINAGFFDWIKQNPGKTAALGCASLATFIYYSQSEQKEPKKSCLKKPNLQTTVSTETAIPIEE